jgi:hypothetical protein
MACSLEALRLQQCIKQVSKQADGYQTGDGVFHCNLLQLVARFCESPKNQKDSRSNREIKKVDHSGSFRFDYGYRITGAPQISG